MSGLNRRARRIFGWFTSMVSRIMQVLSLTRRVPIPGAGEVFTPRQSSKKKKLLRLKRRTNP